MAPAESPLYRGDRLRRAKSRCGILTTLAQVGKWKWGWAPSCLLLGRGWDVLPSGSKISCIWILTSYLCHGFFFIILFFLKVLETLIYGCAEAFSGCDERGLLPSCGEQASPCSGCFCCGAQALGRTGFRSCVHGLMCPTARGIFLDQGSKLCPRYWKVDS